MQTHRLSPDISHTHFGIPENWQRLYIITGGGAVAHEPPLQSPENPADESNGYPKDIRRIVEGWSQGVAGGHEMAKEIGDRLMHKLMYRTCPLIEP